MLTLYRHQIARIVAGEPDQLTDQQTCWLMACLDAHRDSEYGRRYGFRNITGIADYQRALPVCDYEDCENAILRISNGESDVLFAGLPAGLETTGGSTRGSKLVPYSALGLNDFSRAVTPWLSRLESQYKLSPKTAYFSISPALRQTETSPSGLTIGMPEVAFLGKEGMEIMARLNLLAPWISQLDEFRDWQLATLYCLVRCQDLSCISVWSPTFFLQLLAALADQIATLLSLLRKGGDIAGYTVSAEPSTARRLQSAIQSGDFGMLWPSLKLVSCWMAGASKDTASQLQQRLPQAHFEPKGLVSTESVTTIPDAEGRPLLASTSGFYEFEDEAGELHTAWQIQPGLVYALVTTTNSGLYRYRTNDLVRCIDFIEDNVQLEFIGRQGIQSDLAGEKLTDAFVGQCLQGLPGFCALCAIDGRSPHYTVICENRFFDDIGSRVSEIEKRICANPQYDYARKLGQLSSLTVTPMYNPLQRYLALQQNQQRIGDIKLCNLFPASTEFAKQRIAAL